MGNKNYAVFNYCCDYCNYDVEKLRRIFKNDVMGR